MLYVYELGLFRISANDSFLELGFLLLILVCTDAQLPVPVGEY